MRVSKELSKTLSILVTSAGKNEMGEAWDKETQRDQNLHDDFHATELDIEQSFGLENDARKIKKILDVILPIYRQSIAQGGLPIHAGLAELNGRGVLLSAPSGTGKSTCCRRLPEYWRPLCDDETLVVLDPPKKYRAHPFPTWSDYFWKHSTMTSDVQYSVPLTSVFFLEQAVTDGIESMGQGKAALMLYESARQACHKFSRLLNSDDQRKLNYQIFNNACAIAKEVPAYRLYVSLHGKFWTEIEQVLSRAIVAKNDT